MSVKDLPRQRVPIGQMNGRWAFLLKLALLTYPILLTAGLTWATWVTASVLELNTFMHAGPRWTEKDAKIQTGVIQEWVRGWVDKRLVESVPPKDVIRRLDTLEQITAATNSRVSQNTILLAQTTGKIDFLVRGMTPSAKERAHGSDDDDQN